jgi:nucleoside-diphosphate-sugar epimerase
MQLITHMNTQIKQLNSYINLTRSEISACMNNSPTKPDFKVAIFGGNGFVGTHIAKELSSRGICVVCVSRTGHKPIHLRTEKWSEKVRWCKGDASQATVDCLKQVDVVISTVGSPPLPTFSQDAFEQQLFANGTCNTKLIESAQNAGIKRLVLLGAKVPWLMNRDGFAYAKGKKMAYEAAEKFTEQSPEHSALILQPGVITGKRYTASGKCIPLNTLLGPFGVLMPWQFVSVERIANRIADELLSSQPMEPRFSVIKNSKI